MRPPKRYIEDFYGGKGCDYKVREVYPPEPSSSACDFDPNGSNVSDLHPNGNEVCDFDPEGNVDSGNCSNLAVDRGTNILSKEIKSVSAQVRKHMTK